MLCRCLTCECHCRDNRRRKAPFATVSGRSVSENGRKNTAESSPYRSLLPAADYGYKKTHPLSVLQPKAIIFTKGSFKTAQQERSRTPLPLSAPHILFYTSNTSLFTVICLFLLSRFAICIFINIAYADIDCNA